MSIISKIKMPGQAEAFDIGVNWKNVKDKPDVRSLDVEVVDEILNIDKTNEINIDTNKDFAQADWAEIDSSASSFIQNKPFSYTNEQVYTFNEDSISGNATNRDGVVMTFKKVTDTTLTKEQLIGGTISIPSVSDSLSLSEDDILIENRDNALITHGGQDRVFSISKPLLNYTDSNGVAWSIPEAGTYLMEKVTYGTEGESYEDMQLSLPFKSTVEDGYKRLLEEQISAILSKLDTASDTDVKYLDVGLYDERIEKLDAAIADSSYYFDEETSRDDFINEIEYDVSVLKSLYCAPLWANDQSERAPYSIDSAHLPIIIKQSLDDDEEEFFDLISHKQIVIRFPNNVRDDAFSANLKRFDLPNYEGEENAQRYKEIIGDMWQQQQDEYNGSREFSATYFKIESKSTEGSPVYEDFRQSPITFTFDKEQSSFEATSDSSCKAQIIYKYINDCKQTFQFIIQFSLSVETDEETGVNVVVPAERKCAIVGWNDGTFLISCPVRDISYVVPTGNEKNYGYNLEETLNDYPIPKTEGFYFNGFYFSQKNNSPWMTYELFQRSVANLEAYRRGIRFYTTAADKLEDFGLSSDWKSALPFTFTSVIDARFTNLPIETKSSNAYGLQGTCQRLEDDPNNPGESKWKYYYVIFWWEDEKFEFIPIDGVPSLPNVAENEDEGKVLIVSNNQYSLADLDALITEKATQLLIEKGLISE